LLEMNARKPPATEFLRPTPAELGILRVLWRLGPATVREVHEELCEDEDTGYTTVLKFLQIMHGKGLVERDESRRAHVYTARLVQSHAQKLMTSQLVEGVFDGSMSKLVMAVLGDSGRTTPEELAEIRGMLDKLERRKK
jgi:BlaI family penicillinase repressor